MKILFTGGGTGGHIFPIIAVAREIKKIYFRKGKKDIQFVYVGAKNEWSERFLSHDGIKVRTILTGKIRRYWKEPKAILENLIDICFKIPVGALQVLFYIFFENPDLIFSKGGYDSFFVCLWGKLFRTPVFIHESDVAPGLSNKILSRLALEVFVSFPKTEYFPVEKIISAGNPIRREILEGSKEKAKEKFNLQLDKPVVLIMGGSQGAQRINDMLLIILPEILEHFEIIHCTGRKNLKQVKEEAEVVIPSAFAKYYHPFGFLEEQDLKNIYQATDFIVSRAGSGSIFEIAALEKPSILIPLSESAQNHQVKNAYSYASLGASIVIEEENLSPHFFLEKVKSLFARPRLLQEMSLAAQAWARPKSAQVIAAYMVEYLLI